MEGGGGGGAVSEKPEGGASYTYWVREVREDAAPLPVPRKLTPGDILNSQPATLGSVWNSVPLFLFSQIHNPFSKSFQCYICIKYVCS
jgi:hypothetical protein